MHRIEAELLIPGRGGPVSDGVVVLDGPSISYAGPAGVAPPTPGAPVTRVTAVMPGMWECHGHLLGTRTFDLGQLPLEPEALRTGPTSAPGRSASSSGGTRG
jgi:imidazolonepropionase-like amidohydrolase